ncbi:flagellar filament capping protein FliD [Stutzerimonas xanthomarina]|uniref:Flagellar hook-associated protein 2 n=2 Tax=Stutzerimonas xanthomarina TaxID=271420 RepID=A0A1M5NC46_9GAMM|nr:flagellar filament capping protein FliD [Stutzerimonas xanthomarina]MCP9340783.1 flagellar filament capping protein FliD [Stutzerimonas xanthomarina]SEH81235.1 flagellar hook-associated protein 2 [Stutzerimonas xanthomarina]SHG86759.1 flagellar hook-associated protein 2 [Stutzerimonas xanthomarina DSM 18231]
MAGITGIGSGIDIDSLVSGMVAAERAPKEAQLARLEKQTTTKITSLGSLRSAMSAFQTSLEALNKPDLFKARSATSSNKDALAATATTTAGAGSYQVEVKSLASSSKIVLGAVAGEDARLGAGSLEIAIGASEPIKITVAEPNNSLADIRDFINKAGADQGLTATIVTDTQGQRLILSSSKTGKDEDISVVAKPASGEPNQSLSLLAFDPKAEPLSEDHPDYAASARAITQAASAELTIDGLAVVSATNKVEGVIEGVTLELKAKTETDKPLTVGVSLDKSGVTSNVQKFVDAYNKLMGVISSETNITQVADGKPPVVGGLVGDATARTVQRSIQEELARVSDGKFRALSDIGVTTQRDGTLKVDSTKLDKALADSFEDIAGLFTGEAGLATRLSDKLKPYTETGGVLQQRHEAMTGTISSIDKQKEDLTRRITSLQDRLYKQFNAMDLLVGQLANTSSSLIASLENLPWAAGNSKR